MYFSYNPVITLLTPATNESQLSSQLQSSEAQSDPDLDSLGIDIVDVAAHNTPLSDAMKWKLIKTRKPGAAVNVPSQKLSDKSRKGGERMRYCNRSWLIP